ncbi:natural product biosynthesis luciferase-like monooxygenase protein [Streptomyces umbrinus]|uniref:Natural product biosynthesis luciferase-like monooxygenase protein n=1 Tax=Streptomyces umbrinus TaxID=67370 RepID=A0ABU0SXL0_9ACTN|nr:MupA/Atu3671 family FMN-dependent luciferase-like monooxygenase [Streptomyces umbrinus]MDQ1028296.1 natural product biosynthesis luciferase-like monooxygenase protein [Streptomyces umbrinus]
MSTTAADRAAELSRKLTAQLAAAKRHSAAGPPGATSTPPQAQAPIPAATAPAAPTSGAPTSTPDTLSTPAQQPTLHGPRVTLPEGSGMVGDGADAGQRAYAVELGRRLSEQTSTSKELAQRQRAVLADSRAVVGFRRSTKETLYPLAARSARGARLTDVDGNEYTDITMGFGALLLGHEPEVVTEAVREQLAQGLRFGARPVEAGEVAQLLADLTGMDRVAFAGSGTEANSAAIRLARAATGRDRIVMFRGSYHGHIDSVLGRPGPDGVRAVPVSHGIPHSAVSEVIVLEYGSQEALDTVDALGDTIAAVLVEPVQCRNPALRPVAFLRELRDLTRRRGIVLLFDEMLTGLRPHPRGAQHHFGVVPDLATYGKALGSGFPIGAIAGRADILDGVDGGFWRYGDDSRPETETTFFGGTYMQHPLSMAAAKAVLTHLAAEGPALQERLNARTDILAEGLNEFFRAEEFPLELSHFGSMFRFTHRADMELLYQHLLLRGIHVWEWRSFYLSTAHTDADVERVSDAVKDSLRALREGGFFPTTRPSSSLNPSPNSRPRPKATRPRPAADFGVYFFGDYPDAEPAGDEGGTVDGRPSAPRPSDAYDQIMETARFADERGFSSLWVPERHFHSFGGLFPNPSVLAAALARETGRIRLNAGSVVLPLHDPVRIAEEWSVVDNLSGGRVGIGCATGWHAQDFALHPDRFARRKEIGFAHLDDVRTLWSGGTLSRRTGDGGETAVRIHPRPVQDMPPMFLATSGRRESYEEAARRGLGIVTNLMNQTVAELAENIGHYRKAREQHGLDPDTGRVTVLLHTYLGDDHATARAQALEPMTRYLRSSLQMRSAASTLGGDPRDVATASEEDLEYLFRRAYDGYCDERALIGTPETCAPVVDALYEAGVDEIAALVDFGMPADLMRSGLEHLDALRERHQGAGPAATPPGNDVSAPATDAQRRIWLASQLIGDPAAYNEIQAVRLRGPLDAEALAAAVDGLVERHAGLRTVFRPGGGDETVLQVVRHGRRVPLQVTDVRGRLTDAQGSTQGPAQGPEPDAVVAAVLREESSRPYDLAEGPLFTPRLLTLADDDHVLVLGLHHIVTDAHSAGILAADLEELYKAAVEGRPARFAASAGSTVGAAEPDRDPADLEWWRGYLDPLPPVPALPTRRPRGRRVAGSGAATEIRLDGVRTAEVQEWSGRQGVTLFATLLTAWQLVLRERSGQDEFVVGSTFGRRTPETTGTVGFHVAFLPLRATLTESTPLTDAVRATRDALFAADAHQHVDLDALLATVNPDPGNPRPLITVSADLDTAPLAGIRLPGLYAEAVDGGSESAPLEMGLMAVRTGSGLRLRIRYDADLFDAATVRDCLGDLDRILGAMMSGGAVLVRDTAVRPPEPGDVTRPASPTPDPAPASAPSAPSVLETLRTVWKSVLDVDDVADDSNFFDLSGNSIAAIRLVNRVRDALHVDIALADFFAEATLGAMARQLGGAGLQEPAPTPSDNPEVVDRAPASDQQNRMIAGHYAVPQAQVWNVPTRIRFRGALDPDALRSALAELIERHHSLRTRFVREAGAGAGAGSGSGSGEGVWWQEVVAAPPLRLQIDDLTRLEPGKRAARVDKVCRAMAAAPVDLTRPTLPRLRLLRVEHDEWVLMFVMHHICADGWAHSVLLAELAELYTAAAAGTAHALDAPPVQATHYARRQLESKDPSAEDRRAAHCAAYLEGVPCRLDTPTDRPRPERLSGDGGTARGSASGELRSAMEKLAADRHVTPFAVAAAALGIHLARLSGERDVLLSVPYANREDLDCESLVSVVSTAVLVRVRIDPAETVAELVTRTGAGALGIMANVLPTARILQAMRDAGATEVPDRVPNGLAFQNYADSDIEIPGLDVEVEDVAPPVARAELVFGLAPRRDPGLGYRTFLEYSADLWDRESAEDLLAEYVSVIGDLCAQPDRPVAALLDPHTTPRKADAE